MSCYQMVMEFPDIIKNVDRHEMNSSRWKQFSEVSTLTHNDSNSLN